MSPAPHRHFGVHLEQIALEDDILCKGKKIQVDKDEKINYMKETNTSTFLSFVITQGEEKRLFIGRVKPGFYFKRPTT